MHRGVYKTHLGKACGNRNIILAPTMRNPAPYCADGAGGGEIDYDKPSEGLDLYYESDPISKPAGHAHEAISDDVQVTYDLDTEVLNNNTSVAVEQTHYPAARKTFRRWRGMSKNTVIGVRRHGLHFLLHKGFNLLLGSLKVKHQSYRSMVSFQIVFVA